MAYLRLYPAIVLLEAERLSCQSKTLIGVRVVSVTGHLGIPFSLKYVTCEIRHIMKRATYMWALPVAKIVADVVLHLKIGVQL